MALMHCVKPCCKCKKIKLITSFVKNKNSNDGFNWSCKDCNKYDLKGQYKDKVCSVCKINKTPNEFCKDRNNATGLGICKLCRKEKYLKSERERMKNKNLSIANSIKPVINNKICFNCKKEKNISSFSKRKYSKDGFEGNCKECLKIQRQTNKYREINRKSSRKRYNKIKDDINHINERRSYNREYYKKRLNDVNFKLRKSISAIIRNACKRNDFSKGGKSIKNVLNYSIKDLKHHLENHKEWKSWMNWNNWGKYDPKTWDDKNPETWTWQIDHIIPHSDLSYDSMEHPNFKKCWSLDNLRPYSAKQNIFDGVHRTRHKNV